MAAQSSGGYGWRTGKSLALAMVKPEPSNIEGSEVDVRILGETRRAVVIGDSPYDPTNASLAGLSGLGDFRRVGDGLDYVRRRR